MGGPEGPYHGSGPLWLIASSKRTFTFCPDWDAGDRTF
jgi:hypothetical protein